jgi:hypothetical protein
MFDYNDCGVVMTQIDIHTKFIIFVSVAPQQEQGKVDIAISSQFILSSNN